MTRLGDRVISAQRSFVNRFLDARAWLADRTAKQREWAKPVTEPVTPAAIFVAILTVTAGIFGWLWGWNELIVGFWMGIALLAVCVIFILGHFRMDAQLDLNRDRVVVGERANGRLLLTNTAQHRSRALTIELPVGRANAAFDLPSLAAGEEHEDLFAIPTQRRAVLDVGPVTSVRSDPFGLLRRDQHLAEVHVLYVHPRTVRIESSASGLIRDLEGQTVRKLSDSDVAFHALRPYVAGDDRRYIHWKSSARTGTLMVRQFEETRRSHLLLTLSTRLDDYLSDDEFELAVSVAGSLGVQCLSESQTLTATTSTQTFRSPTPKQLLDRLSGVDFERSAGRMSDVVRHNARTHDGASVAIIVCGSIVDQAELRRARRHVSLDVRTFVIVCSPGAQQGVRPMGDFDIVTLGELADLPSMMRRITA